MATKKCVILFEPFSDHVFGVYTDLDIDAIMALEGVTNVDDCPRYLVVVIDRRYDTSEVIEDITNLAKKLEEENI